MVKIRAIPAITFDDVLLVPKKTSSLSRSDVDLSTQLTKKIRLKIPIISANMDTVTEVKMAIALAQAGGIGIIHRFLTIEEQARQVNRVKRFENYKIDNPITAPTSATFGQLQEIMADNNITSIIIVDKDSRLKGLVTARDWMFVKDTNIPATKIMTPMSKLITALPTIKFKEAQVLLLKHKVEKLPLVDRDGKVKGLITAHDVRASLSDDKTVRDEKGRLLVGAAVGIKEEDIIRAGVLTEAGVDVIVIDIAHGHSTHLIKALKKLKKNFPGVEVIAGNVATYEGTRELVEAGADAIKVGIGPGSLCTTRVVAGAGIPQITAVMDAVKAGKQKHVPIIADGGIRYSGDVVKALASGASTVMIGSFFYGTRESPAMTFYRHGKRYKLIRGMASLTANNDRRKLDIITKNALGGIRSPVEEYTAEGVEAIVPYSGAVADIINQLIGGIRSGFSYSGADNIKELWKKAEFVRISHSALIESHPHDVSMI